MSGDRVHTDDLPLLPPQPWTVVVTGAGALFEAPGIAAEPEIAWGMVTVVRTPDGRPAARQAVDVVAGVRGAAAMIAAIQYFAESRGLSLALAAEVDQAMAYYRHMAATQGYQPPPGTPAGGA